MFIFGKAGQRLAVTKHRRNQRNEGFAARPPRGWGSGGVVAGFALSL